MSKFIIPTLLVLLISQTRSAPLEVVEPYHFKAEDTAIKQLRIEDTTTSITPSTTTSITPSTTTSMTTSTTTSTTTTTTLAPEIDREWEDLVLAGPTVINYHGLFMILGSRQDQALTAPVGYTVKYINDMKSLRAVLIAVSSAMKTVVQLVKNDLIRIQNTMNQIPEHIKAGLLLIQTAPNTLLNKLLPYTLNNVDRAANEGSTVSKLILNQFVSVGLFLEELALVINSTPRLQNNTDYLLTAIQHSADLKTQWNLLISLFEKFSKRADLTQQNVIANFSGPIKEAQQNNGFNSEQDRKTQLDKIIPTAIMIDQSSNLLDTMIRTYADISNEHMENQINSNNYYLTLMMELSRATMERKLWQDTLSQLVKVARLAQERHNQFVETSLSRHDEYYSFAKNVSSFINE